MEPLVGTSGYLTLHIVEIFYSRHRESRLTFAGYTENGKPLTQKQMRRMFELDGMGKSLYDSFPKEHTEKLEKLFDEEKVKILNEIAMQNGKYFDEETAKLEKWSQDVKISMERELREVDKKLAETRTTSRSINTLQKKLEAQEQIKTLESRRNQLRMDIYGEQDKIDNERERLIEEVKGKLTQRVESKRLFMVRWNIE